MFLQLPRRNSPVSSSDSGAGQQCERVASRLQQATGEHQHPLKGSRAAKNQGCFCWLVRSEKVRNFLVFQGDVEATAQRQGKELHAAFENHRVNVLELRIATCHYGCRRGPDCLLRANLWFGLLSPGRRPDLNLARPVVSQELIAA